MTATTPSAALVRVAPVFTNTERRALAGFLVGYSSLTAKRRMGGGVSMLPPRRMSPTAAPPSL